MDSWDLDIGKIKSFATCHKMIQNSATKSCAAYKHASKDYVIPVALGLAIVVWIVIASFQKGEHVCEPCASILKERHRWTKFVMAGSLKKLAKISPCQRNLSIRSGRISISQGRLYLRISQVAISTRSLHLGPR